IMNRYGDTPQGMVESALEFARVCRKNDYHDFMFSMKSSNPQVMVMAYRLLVAEMMKLGWDYPLHLGVTEAGQGEDGRIKSAMGIGSLLLDGIGDTIRVSLTEDAWNEIDPCRRLVDFARSYEGRGVEPFEESHRHVEAITRRSVAFPKKISMHRDGTVFAEIGAQDLLEADLYQRLGMDVQLGRPKLKISSADCVVLKDHSEALNPILKHLHEIGVSVLSSQPSVDQIPMLTLAEALVWKKNQSKTERFAIFQKPLEQLIVQIENETPAQWESLLKLNPAVIVLAPSAFPSRLHYCRHFFEWLQKSGMSVPVILKFDYACSKEDLIIQAGAEYGALLCDGLGEGIWISANFDLNFLRTLSFNILQAARMRSSKTDFISCPSCGRTLFDLQDVSKRIRERTDHLPGVKIAIMGCIVNGPGEMADADFGYVGSKPERIDLYVGKECVEKDIHFSEADDRLVELIKKHGRWVEKEEASIP
ncbi:MAG: flavodoxin-dependent (E)-4-hydroxy-3-methylbut-2-enyl-diphosphate synthase, partial [Parachlamydiaceae bacterium]